MMKHNKKASSMVQQNSDTILISIQ